MKTPVLSVTMILLASAICLNTYAQGKARITIKKNDGGIITEEFREIEIDSMQDMNTVLKNLGVLDDFNLFGEGQQFEINIDQYNDLNDKNLQLRFQPDRTGPYDRERSQAYLGVMLKDNKDQNPKEKNTGVVITEIVDGSAAETAGLLKGDLIVQIDKLKVTATTDVISYIKSKKPQDEVTLKIKRDGKSKTIKTRLGSRSGGNRMQFPFDQEMPGTPSPYNFRFDLDSIMIYPDFDNKSNSGDSLKICQPFAWRNNGMDMKETAFLGVTPSSETATKGVRVEIEPESSAQSMELQNGDVIIKLNNQEVNSFGELAAIIGKMNPNDEIEVVYERDGKQKTTKGKLGSRTVSRSDDFRIFHDFKGMDDGGDYLYDYQFDMDAGDLEKHMEELLRNLEQQQDMLSDEKLKLEENLEKFRNEKKSVSIKISIAEIDDSEKQQINTKATPKLENKNDLEFDEISFFPNPNNGVINLKFKTLSSDKVKLVIFDSDGAIIFMEEKSNIPEGDYQNIIDIADQPNGTYYLQIMQGAKTYSKKIIKSE